MRVLFVHPSRLMYAEILLRLEPLGVERVAGAARQVANVPEAIELSSDR